jgi:hypothetical protein
MHPASDRACSQENAVMPKPHSAMCALDSKHFVS